MGFDLRIITIFYLVATNKKKKKRKITPFGRCGRKKTAVGYCQIKVCDHKQHEWIVRLLSGSLTISTWLVWLCVCSSVSVTHYAAESFSWYSRERLKQAWTPPSFQSLLMTPASSTVMKPSSAEPASTNSCRASSWRRNKGGVRVVNQTSGRNYTCTVLSEQEQYSLSYWVASGAGELLSWLNLQMKKKSLKSTLRAL